MTIEVRNSDAELITDDEYLAAVLDGYLSASTHQDIELMRRTAGESGKLIASRPDWSEALLAYARVHSWLRDGERARSAYEQVVHLSQATEPERLEARIGLGRLALLLERPDEAVKEFRRALARALLHPTDPDLTDEAVDGLSTALAAAGHPRLARDWETRGTQYLASLGLVTHPPKGPPATWLKNELNRLRDDSTGGNRSGVTPREMDRFEDRVGRVLVEQIESRFRQEKRHTAP